MDLKWFDYDKKNTRNYPDIESARRPVPHTEKVSVPEFIDLPDLSMECDQFHEEVKAL